MCGVVIYSALLLYDGRREELFQELLTLDPKTFSLSLLAFIEQPSTVLTLKMSLVMQSLHTLVIIIHLINSVGVVNYMKPQVFRCVVVIYSALLLYNGRQDKLFHRSYSPWIKTFSPSWLQTTPSSSNSHITALQTITSHIYNGI